MKTKIYIVPIEPLNERYTEQWYRNFPKHFIKEGFSVKMIDGTPLINHVDKGTFLDINSTIYYKSEQLKKIAKMFYKGEVKNGDVFFIMDLEFWGIETIRYMADLQNIKIKIYGFLHAGSYTTGDYMEPMAPCGKYFEIGWMKICDGIFVGSKYHKQVIINKRLKPFASPTDINEITNKIFVSGNPFFIDEYGQHKDYNCEKKKQIIISNRFDWEKRPNISLDFAQIIKHQMPDVEIVVTTSRPKFKSNKKWLVEYARVLEERGIIKIYDNLSKDEYHQILSQSMVMLSNTIEENFGYCVVEACLYNTYPLVKNAYSHPELVKNDKRLLFDDEDEIIDKIKYLLNSNFDVKHYAEKYNNSIKTIIGVIKNAK